MGEVVSLSQHKFVAELPQRIEEQLQLVGDGGILKPVMIAFSGNTTAYVDLTPVLRKGARNMEAWKEVFDELEKRGVSRVVIIAEATRYDMPVGVPEQELSMRQAAGTLGDVASGVVDVYSISEVVRGHACTRMRPFRRTEKGVEFLGELEEYPADDDAVLQRMSEVLQ